MLGLERILLPVDFSKQSYGTAQYARALAGHFQSELHVIHVLNFGVHGLWGLGADESIASGFISENRSAIESALESFLREELAGFNVKPVLIPGDPGREIVKYAHTHQCGLIMLPTHGYGPFRHFLLGSTTAKVLHDADCPVWTGVHMERASVEQSPSFRRIMCAVDLGPHSSKVLSWAWELTREVKGELTIVHMLPDIPGEHSHFFGKWERAAEQQARKEIQELQQTTGVQAEICIELGEFPTAISQAAERLKSDLLVIGRGVASGVLGRLRTYSYAIIRQSPCPVVSV